MNGAGTGIAPDFFHRDGKEYLSEPLVSVVTPFYNTVEFLAECIESVLRQTYGNWEYVLVDNCSTDGSGEIAAQYASRFPGKIRLIRTQSFLSQVENYNFALTCIAADSKYTKMVQADDWIFPECVSRMVDVAEVHPDVGIVSAYELAGDSVQLDGLPYSVTHLDGREACRLYFLKSLYLFGTPTSLLYRSDLIHGRAQFFEERYAPFEDGHVCFDLLKSCSLGFVHQVLTFSRRDNDGIIERVRGFGMEPFLNFSLLVAHGKHYFSSREYSLCLRQAEKQYFLFLTKSACALRSEPKEFWEFHRKGLSSINYVYDWRRLVRWLPRAVIEKMWGVFWRILDRESLPSVDKEAGRSMRADSS
jgi:glycosyltransferase involved in cell wall biosynthesis